MARKILIDTDPGIDDAMALALAFAARSLEVEAVTATGGVVSPDQATRNLQIVVEQLDPPHWPRIGTADAEQILRCDAREIHGSNGLGDVEFTVSELQHRHSSDKLICDTVRQSPGEVTILALGPLSNIASAMRRDPELAGMIGHLVIMGGAIAAPGNVSPVAEFNTHCDALSARAVYRSLTTMTVVPLDVTRKVKFDYDFLEKLPSESTRTGALLRKILPCAYRSFYQRLGLEELHLHAVVVLVAAMQPELFQTERLHCDIEVEGELTHGMMVADRRFAAEQQPNVDVAIDVNAEAVIDCVLRLLAEGVCGGVGSW